MRNEGRFRVVEKTDPERYRRLMDAAQKEARRRHAVYEQLAGVTVPSGEGDGPPAAGRES